MLSARGQIICQLNVLLDRWSCECRQGVSALQPKLEVAGMI